MCFVALCVSWSRKRMRRMGSPLMRRMCRGHGTWGHGCGLHACGMVLRSPSMWHMCCAVMGFVPGRLWWWVRHVGSPSPSSCMWRGVTVAVFAHAAWGHRRRCATCVAVMVFVCVIVVGVVHGVMVVVFTCVAWCCSRRRCGVCVLVVGFAPGRLWWWVRHVGLLLPSLRTWRGVVVAIFVRMAWGCHHCLHTCLMGSSPLMRHVCCGRSLRACRHRRCGALGRGCGLLPLHCMHHGCHLCAACGVAVALFAPCGVSLVPLLCQV
jgi:hypothetical protein